MRLSKPLLKTAFFISWAARVPAWVPSLILSSVVALPCYSATPSKLGKAPLFKVAIDPGHGGADEGAVFVQGRTRITEKAVTLMLSKQIANQLRAKGYQVLLTRTKDQEVSLSSRTNLANRRGADVFISIHMNSTRTSQKFGQPQTETAEGAETFILNNTTDASSKRLARLENKASAERGHRKQDDIALILKDLRLDGNLSESKQLACNIQGNLSTTVAGLYPNGYPASRMKKKSNPRANRGVKQALFYVLLGADMPSVLVEAGFLNSARDRALVLSSQGRNAIAVAVSNAIDQYRISKQNLKLETKNSIGRYCLVVSDR